LNKIDDFWEFFVFEKGESITVNGLPTTAIISNASDKPSYYDDKYLRTATELKTGDTITYQSKTWLVISQVDKKEKSYRAKMRRSNYKVKFVLVERLYEFDTIIETLSVAVDERKYIATVAGKITVTLPADTYSDKINVDIRFLKLGYAWIGVDRSQNGLNIIHAEKDVIGVNDDIDNEIANKSLIAVWSITVIDENRQVNVGMDYNYLVTVLKNGAESTGATLIWQSSNESIATVVDGAVHGLDLGFVTISVFMAADPSIKLDLNIEIAENIPDVITYRMYKAYLDGTGKDYTNFSIEQSSTMLFGMEKYINGALAANDTYTFTLDPNGVPAGNYVYTVLNSSSVKIQNKQMSTPKLILTAISEQSGHIISQNIQLKALW
jgi:hypothetical protein